MEKINVKGKLAAGIALTGLLVLLIVWILGVVWPNEQVGAAENGVQESEEISTGKGNGPGEVTELADMGITIQGEGGSDAGLISGNTVAFGDINRSGWSYSSSSRQVLSGSNLSFAVPISQNRSWGVSGTVLLPRCETSATFCSLEVELKDQSGAVYYLQVADYEAGGYGRYLKVGDKKQNIPVDSFGVTQNWAVSYNAGNKELTLKYGSSYSVSSACSLLGDIVNISFGGRVALSTDQPKPSDSEGINRTKMNFTFNSFRYTDYYMKSSVHLEDYAKRKITGGAGNGQTVSVHPKIYNNSEKSQRYSGTVEIDRSDGIAQPLENVTPKGSIDVQPVSFTHTQDAFQDKDFKALISSGAFSPGQKFRLPLLIKDNYFCSTALDGLTGVPETWKNLKYDGEEQLPFSFLVERDTCRALQSDLDVKSGYDYTHTLNGKTIKPNDHGWYNSSVTLSLKNVNNEFNELNLSSAEAGGEITADSIVYTGTLSAPITVQGTGKNGESADADGDTYQIFGRKGTAAETEDLSAVTSETFRIDKTAPALVFAKRAKDEDRRTLKAEDALSGIDYIKWKGPKDTEYPDDGSHVIQIEQNSQATSGVTAADSIDMPAFTELGNYTFCAVDLAGNESKELTVSNSRPTLDASNAKVAFVDTIADFSPYKIHKAKVSDKEDKLDADRVTWTISREGYADITGDGEEVLTEYLPIGTYTVSFALDGEGEDSDGNEPDPNPKKVTLTITSGNPPAINDRETAAEDPVDGKTLVQKDGTKHYLSEDSIGIIANPQDPYSGGTLTDAEIQKAIEDKYKFKSQLPAPANSLTVTITVQNDKGEDMTGQGIPTDKKGEYLVIYCVTDASGCTTTLQRTYKIKENAIATFLPGKGDFADGDLSKEVTVKINEAPKAESIPGANELETPTEKCFAGWGTKPGNTQTVRPEEIVLQEDTNYYAVYADDVNRDNIPDSEQALFYFMSSDTDRGVFKNTDKTVVGILVPEGASACLSAAQIPSMLIEKGYKLKGWQTDTTGDKLLNTNELCDESRGRGSKIIVTAVFDKIQETGTVSVTFFSSDPVNAPLKGGEGQTIQLKVSGDGKTVSVPAGKIPEVKLSKGCTLEGWKTEKTGDELMDASKISLQKLKSGDTLACVAYVKTPVQKEVIKEEKIKEKTKERKAVQQAPQVQEDIRFVFYSSRAESGSIKGGDGTLVTVKAADSGFGQISQSRLPKLKLVKNSRFIGWTTSLTKDRLLTSKELSSLKVAAGTAVNCTAVFSSDKIKVTDNNGNKEISIGNQENLTSIRDGEVPLGSAPFKNRQKTADCRIHFFMLIWLALLAASMITRLLRRRKMERYLFSNEENWQEEFNSPEEVMEMAGSQKMGNTDYIFLMFGAGSGFFLNYLGICWLEIPLLTIGLAGLLLYFLYMKALDYYSDKKIKDIVR